VHISKPCVFQALVILPILMLSIAGCGRPSVVKVEGVVTLDGKPLPGATVSFMPAHEGQGQLASGRTDADGSFRLTTFRTDDGALPGEYKIIVTIKEADEKFLGRNPKTFTDEEKREARMGTMTPAGKKKAAEKKKAPSQVPAIYRDVNQTPLKEVVPTKGKIELALRSGAR
jgi:hypothetical protein